MTEKPALDEIERRRAYHRDWYQKNKERLKERHREQARAYYTKNKERIRRKNRERTKQGYYRDYYREHTAEHLESVRAYRSRLTLEQKQRIRLLERERDRLAGDRGGAARSRRKIRFTPELISRCMELQGNACAICRRPFTLTGKARACADHCHDTLRPRGLLCFTCNITEGKIRDTGLSPLEFAQRLHDYLLRPPAST